MSLVTTSKINRLLSESVPGGLFFAEWLRKKNYSSQLLKKYRDSEWLDSLCRGVMYRKNASLSALAAIYCFNKQTDNRVRIAAHSALEYLGFSHYVPMGKPKLMVALQSNDTYEWIKSDQFDMSIFTFHTKIFNNPGTQYLLINNLPLLISSPEQAFLECLNLVPEHYNYMDLYYIMEQLTALDPIKVQTALVNTSSQKVKRMFLYMAEKAGHYWVNMINQEDLNITTSKLQLVKNGVFISKYRITVPKELFNYE